MVFASSLLPTNATLSSVTNDKGDIVQYLYAVYGLGDAFYGEDFIADLAVGTEINIRIFTAGGLDVIQLDLFEGTLSGGRLLGFGSIGGETGDKFLQLLDLFFLLPVCFFHLLDDQLAGFIPEIVVAGIELNLAVVDVCDLGADFI